MPVLFGTIILHLITTLYDFTQTMSQFMQQYSLPTRYSTPPPSDKVSCIDVYANVGNICPYNLKCTNPICCLLHSTKTRHSPAKIQHMPNLYKKKQPCKFGSGCGRPECPYFHNGCINGESPSKKHDPTSIAANVHSPPRDNVYRTQRATPPRPRPQFEQNVCQENVDGNVIGQQPRYSNGQFNGGFGNVFEKPSGNIGNPYGSRSIPSVSSGMPLQRAIAKPGVHPTTPEQITLYDDKGNLFTMSIENYLKMKQHRALTDSTT